jgi:L-rhamnose mutarotase
MKRIAFKMHLHRGNEAEYKRRHDALWPELKTLLKESGIADYSIFLDEETYTLFGILKVEDEGSLENLQLHPVMKKWWAYMKDLMQTNPDHSPVSIQLKEVFYLP